jgi:quinoprotein glucose dehydrogenase
MAQAKVFTIAMLVGISALWLQSPRAQQPGIPSTANGEWPSYAGDLASTHYSPLDQINGSNFSTLDVAWRFKTDSLGPRPEQLEGTPLMAKGVLYTTGGTRRSAIRARRGDWRVDVDSQRA